MGACCSQVNEDQSSIPLLKVQRFSSKNDYLSSNSDKKILTILQSSLTRGISLFCLKFRVNWKRRF